MRTFTTTKSPSTSIIHTIRNRIMSNSTKVKIIMSTQRNHTPILRDLANSKQPVWTRMRRLSKWRNTQPRKRRITRGMISTSYRARGSSKTCLNRSLFSGIKTIFPRMLWSSLTKSNEAGRLARNLPWLELTSSTHDLLKKISRTILLRALAVG